MYTVVVIRADTQRQAGEWRKCKVDQKYLQKVAIGQKYIAHLLTHKSFMVALEPELVTAFPLRENMH